MRFNRPLKVIILGIVVVGILLGVVIYFSPWIEPPKFKMAIEIGETRYQVGEKIFFKTVLTNMGWLPVTIVHGKPAAFVYIYDETGEVLEFFVYDDDGNIIWQFPHVQLLIALYTTLWPRRPFYLLAPHSEWGVKLPPHHRRGWKAGYSLRLEKPGRYKITSFAPIDICPLWREERIKKLEIHAEPVWIEIIE